MVDDALNKAALDQALKEQERCWSLIKTAEQEKLMLVAAELQGVGVWYRKEKG